MFMNEYSHTIDAKGRMILPAKFREELGSRFVLAPSLDTCLNIYPKERWDALTRPAARSSPFTNRNVRKIMRHLIGRGTEMEWRPPGAILIPAHLREFAKLKKGSLHRGDGPHHRDLGSGAPASGRRGRGYRRDRGCSRPSAEF